MSYGIYKEVMVASICCSGGNHHHRSFWGGPAAAAAATATRCAALPTAHSNGRPVGRRPARRAAAP